MRFATDERLVARAKRGDRRAFEEIFERYHQDLYRFCLTLVGSRQDAEDRRGWKSTTLSSGVPFNPSAGSAG
jgi:hypothetical protein